ncbi:MAG: aminoacetone oxidase family FAD-binding enzyme [Chlorobiaceae bacterium]|jgi:predicted Rossmann fold flavoprotein|nr:aminoacetone oxidase family FAD-binding enzyme [Chlorobiaceae bacterium]NTV16513.1 aminoacetone oxidase family FAD-binding enzyme [Chlorobiaceae bacterium]
MSKNETTAGDSEKTGIRHSTILVIGGGAAGMAAVIAARRSTKASGEPCSITLLERNPRPGTKIRISGGGKCNVTHRGTPAELLELGFLRRNEKRFLRHALYSFSNTDLLALLRSKGIETEERADGKVFPASGDAASIARSFEGLLKESRVQQHYSCRVQSVVRNGELFVVTTGDEVFTTECLVLATGGVSYSKTGTTGDGLVIARSLGHSIIKPSAALAPLYTIKSPPASLSGLALRSISLVAAAGCRSVERRGDLLFTHRGFSGPAALSLSRDVAELMGECGNCTLFANLFPEQSFVELEAEFLQQARRNGAQMVRKFLQVCPIAPPNGSIQVAPHGTLPSALVPFIMRHAGLENDLNWGGLPREKRQLLISVLKRFPLGSVREVPIDQGEISAGGVSLVEVNPKTMCSRIVPRLFICGELLDYAGEIGGFNLQAAFSTGWMAGVSAVQSIA